MRRGCEPDLVVDYNVDCPASFVSNQSRKAKTFSNDTLSRKGRIAMQQERQDLCTVNVV